MYLFDFWYCGRRSRVVTHVKFIGGVVSLLGFIGVYVSKWNIYRTSDGNALILIGFKCRAIGAKIGSPNHSLQGNSCHSK